MGRQVCNINTGSEGSPLIFKKTSLEGVYLIEPQKLEDDRGFFARVFCKKEFGEYNLPCEFVQCSISFNDRSGTLRGMHYQAAPYAESKLIRCTMGAIFDVIIDIRPSSPTFLQWISVELSSKNRRILFIPEGFAHGFITLEDNSEVFYQMSQFFYPEAASGIRWNDPLFHIQWPVPVNVISEKDNLIPDFKVENSKL